MQRLEHGEITAIEAIDSLLSEDYSTRKNLFKRHAGCFTIKWARLSGI